MRTSNGKPDSEASPWCFATSITARLVPMSARIAASAPWGPFSRGTTLPLSLSGPGDQGGVINRTYANPVGAAVARVRVPPQSGPKLWLVQGTGGQLPGIKMPVDWAATVISGHVCSSGWPEPSRSCLPTNVWSSRPVPAERGAGGPIRPKGLRRDGGHASAGGPACVLWVQALFAGSWP